MKPVIVQIDDDERILEEFGNDRHKLHLSFDLWQFESPEEFYRQVPQMVFDERRIFIFCFDLKFGDTYTGFDLISYIRAHERIFRSFIFILSDSKSDEDVRTAYALGANLYLSKGAFEDNSVGDILRVLQNTRVHLSDAAYPNQLPNERWDSGKAQQALQGIDSIGSLRVGLRDLVTLVDQKVSSLQEYKPNSEGGKTEKKQAVQYLSEIGEYLNVLNDQIKDLRKIDNAKTQSTLDLFYEKICDWPFDNADEIVDGVMRAGLIGLCASIGALFSATLIGLGVGSFVFGGQKAAKQIGTVLNEALKKSSK